MVRFAIMRTRHNRCPGPIWILVVLGLSLSIPAPAAYEGPQVTGTVRDHGGHPLRKIRVCLRHAASGAEHWHKTDKQGRFAIPNDFEGDCSLAVTPVITSGLSRALIEPVPGKQTRQFIVQLKHGFSISGRVVYKGRGVKGMIVKVLPAGGPAADSSVHGGALATTSGDGSFRIVLTPGEKTLVVVNQRYGGLVPEVRQKVEITGDTRVPDIPLPPVSKQ